VAGAVIFAAATTAQSQTGGGGGAAGAGGAAAGAGAASGAAGATAGANVNPAAGTARPQNPAQVTPNANAAGQQEALPPREQLPPELLQRQQQLQQGATNALGGQLMQTNPAFASSNLMGFSNRFGLSNQFGFSNRFGFSNQFGFSNRFGTNFTDWRSNRFRGTNDFGSRSNRFGGTNDFGGRTNRFRTNQFGLGTNSFTNELTISNSVELSNQFGLGPADVGGFVPGIGASAIGGPGTAAPAAPATAANAPAETPLAATGNPGVNRLFGATTNRGSGVALQDRSVTEADRALLQKARQLVIPRLEAMGGWGPAVHFWIGDRNVTMVGTVPSKEAKNEVQDMVTQLPGVNSVKNDLFVGNVDPNASETDQELLYRLRQSVLPQVAGGNTVSPVDFSVRDGQVTLVGRASSPEEAARVQKLVQQVPGVEQIKNELLISGSNGGSVSASPALPADSANQSTQPNLQPTGRDSLPEANPPGQTQPTPPK